MRYVCACARLCHPVTVCVCVCAAAQHYQPPLHVFSHFEPPLSDSYRLDVGVVAQASKRRRALCIQLVKVNSKVPALNASAARRAFHFTNASLSRKAAARRCVCVVRAHETWRLKWSASWPLRPPHNSIDFFSSSVFDQGSALCIVNALNMHTHWHGLCSV